MIAQAQYKLGQLANSAGKYPDAIRYYDQVLQNKSNPKLVPYALYGKGGALMQTQQFAEAIAPLSEMLLEYPDHPLHSDALLARGIARRNSGQSAEAGEDLKTYLETKPKGLNLGHALYEAALIDQTNKQPGMAAASKSTDTFVPEYPTMDEVLYELGWSLEESGNESAAIKYFSMLTRNHSSSPLFAEAAYYLGQKAYLKEWREAANLSGLQAESRKTQSWPRTLTTVLLVLFKAMDYAASKKPGEMAKLFPKGQFTFDAKTMTAMPIQTGEYQSAYDAYAVARSAILSRNETAKNILDKSERQVRELVFLHGGQSAAQLQKWQTAIECITN